jgi:hypothetical protein
VLDLAKRAVEAEQLGKGEGPDLLCVSLSSNDLVGHCWGPDSQEVLDVTLRTDLLLGELLAFLDARLGKGRYVLVLTADHGVCPLPELARAQGKDAGRVPADLLGARAESYLSEKFGKKDGKIRWIEARPGAWLYLNRKLLQAENLAQADVEAALADWLTRQPGVQAVYTRTQLSRPLPAEDALGVQVKLSFHPARSGDLFVVLRPYYLMATPFGLGTNHGTPHDYDTHVPLLIYGTGIHAGKHDEAVTPLAAAPILAQALGIPFASRTPVPEGVFTSP